MTDDPAEEFWRLDRSSRWGMLEEILETADAATTARLLRRWWPDVEFSSDQALEWFTRASFVTDTSECALTGVLTIYRGGLPDGISWTLERAKAVWFARRNSLFTGEPQDVWRARVQASKVLGYFTQREEDEIVVNPVELEGTEILSQEIELGLDC
jgi:hypothetical protein